MPNPPDSTASCPPPDPAAANEAIRAYVREHGDRPWGERQRAELHRLRSVWLEAVRASIKIVA